MDVVDMLAAGDPPAGVAPFVLGAGGVDDAFTNCMGAVAGAGAAIPVTCRGVRAKSCRSPSRGVAFSRQTVRCIGALHTSPPHRFPALSRGRFVH